MYEGSLKKKDSHPDSWPRQDFWRRKAGTKSKRPAYIVIVKEVIENRRKSDTEPVSWKYPKAACRCQTGL